MNFYALFQKHDTIDLRKKKIKKKKTQRKKTQKDKRKNTDDYDAVEFIGFMP